MGAATVVACTQPSPIKNDLYVCEAGQNGCPKKADPVQRTQTPAQAPERSTTPSKPDKKTDEGDDDDGDTTPPGTPPPSSGAGPECAALSDCCENLRVMGITGSADACARTVRANKEMQCAEDHQMYKTPDDFYEPVCF